MHNTGDKAFLVQRMIVKQKLADDFTIALLQRHYFLLDNGKLLLSSPCCLFALVVATNFPSKEIAHPLSIFIQLKFFLLDVGRQNTIFISFSTPLLSWTAR